MLWHTAHKVYSAIPKGPLNLLYWGTRNIISFTYLLYYATLFRPETAIMSPTGVESESMYNIYYFML